MKIEVTARYPNALGGIVCATSLASSLRMLGLLDWPWWLVLCPAWLTMSAVAAMLAVFLVAREMGR